MNRMCVNIGGVGFIPVNLEPYQVVFGKAERVGDDVVIKAGDVSTTRDVKVRRIRSNGMVKNTDWLVDIENGEAWEIK